MLRKQQKHVFKGIDTAVRSVNNNIKIERKSVKIDYLPCFCIIMFIANAARYFTQN